MNKDKDACVVIGLSVLVVLVLLAILAGWGWYKAGVQAEVYERQGIHMTQWEVFLGAKPAERTINLKQEEK